MVMKRVTEKVTNLVVKREGNNIKGTWKNPTNLTNSKSDKRATWIDQHVNFYRENCKRTEGDVGAPSPRNVTYTGFDFFWIRGQGMATTVTKNYDRKRFHPYSKGKYCKKVEFGVQGGNDNPKPGPLVTANYNFYLPRKPTVKWEYDSSIAKATVTVETNEGKDNYERYDTMVKVSVVQQNGKEKVLQAWAATKLTKWTYSIDLSPYLTGLTEGKTVTVKCWAYARGMAGDNPEQSAVKPVSRTVAMPCAATIKSISVDKKEQIGRIKVLLKVGSWTGDVQLQRRNTDSSDIEQGWSDVTGATDNDNCEALYDSYGDAQPVEGQYIYYRIKSTRDNYVVYSTAKKANCLFTAKPKEVCEATCKLHELSANAAGNQIRVVMAWQETVANTGCELSMSEYGNGWNTSEAPTVFEVTGADSESKLEGWKTKTYSVSGLTPGKTYWFRMRRYKDFASGNRKYSAYDIKGKATSVETESALDDECGIAETSVTGTTATVTIGINEDNANTGTEVSYADSENAWQSNEQPQSFNAEWAKVAYGENGWAYKQTVYLRNLEAGKVYYVRARRYTGDTFSPYSKVKSFTIPGGSDVHKYDVRCGLVSVTAGDDGKSAVVVVGWDGDHTGCEVTWSTDPNAWESSEQPMSTTLDWSDTPRKSSVWSHTSTLYLRNLEEGQTYYARARSYFEGDGDTAWSGYSSDMTVTPYGAPDSVSLTAPEYVADGNPIELWWTIQSELEQVEWRVHEVGKPNVSIANGLGSLCRASIPANQYSGKSSISVYVEAGVGGALTASEPATIAIVSVPSCEVYVPETIASQPVPIYVYTDENTSRFLCTCYSNGTTLEAPDGSKDQLTGDVVWTDSVTADLTRRAWALTQLYARLLTVQANAMISLNDATAAKNAAEAEMDSHEEGDDGWEEAVAAYEDAVAAEANAQAELDAANAALAAHPSDEYIYAGTITMPVTDLLDGGSYTVEVQAAEGIAGLTSERASGTFDVEYSHQAPVPSDDITITTNVGERTAVIHLVEPDSFVEGDVYDLYRKTPDSYELVAEGLDLNMDIEDKYPPFGNDSAYVVSCRTPDGDFAYLEYPYSLPVKTLRFDWGENSIELPWNVSLSDSFEKSFEARSHVDGSVNGYYDKAVIKRGSYSTDVNKVTERDKLELLEKLGSASEPCFCRTANGHAFQCNVDVSGIDRSGMTAAVNVKLDITRVKLTDQFKVVNGTYAEEGQSG